MGESKNEVIKKIIILLLISIFFSILPNNLIQTYAHSSQLDVVYDDCIPSDFIDSTNIGDGYNEKWYELIRNNVVKHIPHTENETTTIKYYLSPTGIEDTSITWSTGLTTEQSEDLLNRFISSMKKWNSIYFYTTNSEGYVIKNKIVNIIEGTKEDYNLIIYPAYGTSYFASTWATGSYTKIDSTNGVYHRHYDNWAIDFDIDIYLNSESNVIDTILERTGAHELGHVLGLIDVDYSENPNDWDSYHHEEILMGYSKTGNTENRQTEITYKDIAGVAITRGFHTDENHSWVSDFQINNDDKYKLICTICNCVKYIDDITEYNVYQYGYCRDDHNLENGNMMPVASYGTKDYYKCMYCRYVAPFTSIIEQDYIILENNNSNYHIKKNQITGLNYKILEEHNFIKKYLNKMSHTKVCLCGYATTENHSVLFEDANDGDKKATCLGCKKVLDLSSDIAITIPTSNNKATVNGSYILPSGIVVLVKEDIELYNQGKLVFYNKEDIPNVA